MVILGGGEFSYERGTPVGEVRACIRECPPFARYPEEDQSERN